MFNLEFDVESEEGLPQATLDNQIRETIRQIGAEITGELLE
jgi:hypothetical protein